MYVSLLLTVILAGDNHGHPPCSGQEAWIVQSCSLFDSTLLVSARVHLTQVQLIHLLTGWDAPVSVSIHLLGCLGTACGNMKSCVGLHVHHCKVTQLVTYRHTDISCINLKYLQTSSRRVICVHMHGLFSIKSQMINLANMKSPFLYYWNC